MFVRSSPLRVQFRVVFLLIVFIGACSKDSFFGRPDVVLFRDFDGTLSAHSILHDTDYTVGPCSENTPIPRDSTINLRLDVNEDGIEDLFITLEHRNKTFCSPCTLYEKHVNIKCSNFGCKVATNGFESINHRLFNKGDLLTKDLFWTPEIDIAHFNSCSVSSDFGEGYIGIKINELFGYIRIARLPHNGLAILEWGLNQIKNKDIKCGQH